MVEDIWPWSHVLKAARGYLCSRPTCSDPPLRRYLEHESWKHAGKRPSADDRNLTRKERKLHFAHGSHESLPLPPTTPEPGIPTGEPRDATSQEDPRTSVESDYLKIDNLDTDSGIKQTEIPSDWSLESVTKQETKVHDPWSEPWSEDSKTDSDNFWGMPSGSVECSKEGESLDGKERIDDPWAMGPMDNDPQHCISDAVTEIKATKELKDQTKDHCSSTSRNSDNLTENLGKRDDSKESTGDGSQSKEGIQDESAVLVDEKPPLDRDVVIKPKIGSVCVENFTHKDAETEPRSKETLEESPGVKSVQEMLDPRCVSEDVDGDLYVVDDTEGSDSDEDKTEDSNSDRLRKMKWIPTRKRDPCPLQECLHLTCEEAFFLSYGLGCLVVLDSQRDPMDLEQMWAAFSLKRPNFVRNYIAYHSLRSRGWVPKTGLKYGADFIVYHKGPAFYHGNYSVLVRSSPQANLRDDLDPTNRTLTWSSVMGIDRVTEQVGKEVLIMHVLRPPGMSDEELKSPLCIPKFKIQEILVKRWVPSRERESSEVEEWL